MYDSAEELIRSSDLVVIATVAAEPHVTDPTWFDHHPVVLHVSLRDLAPEILLTATNIVDDVEHCQKANTSTHLAELSTGSRDFLDGTLNDVMAGRVTVPADRTVVFSPFGLGVLDLAVGKFVYDEIVRSGELKVIDDFFHERHRYGPTASTSARAEHGQRRQRSARATGARAFNRVFDPCGDYAASPPGGDRVVTVTARHPRAFRRSPYPHQWGKSLHPRPHDKHLSDPFCESVQHIMLNEVIPNRVEDEIAFTEGDCVVLQDSSHRGPKRRFAATNCDQRTTSRKCAGTDDRPGASHRTRRPSCQSYPLPTATTRTSCTLTFGRPSGYPLFLKCEGFNFAGSIKLKAATEMVEAAERDGTLRPRFHPGRVLVRKSGRGAEHDRGQQGLPLPVRDGPPLQPHDQADDGGLGRRVHIIDEPDPVSGFVGARIDYVRAACAADDRYVWLNQYSNPSNWIAHYRRTAPAIARQFPQLGRPVRRGRDDRDPDGLRAVLPQVAQTGADHRGGHRRLGDVRNGAGAPDDSRAGHEHPPAPARPVLRG